MSTKNGYLEKQLGLLTSCNFMSGVSEGFCDIVLDWKDRGSNHSAAKQISG